VTLSDPKLLQTTFKHLTTQGLDKSPQTGQGQSCHSFGNCAPICF